MAESSVTADFKAMVKGKVVPFHPCDVHTKIFGIGSSTACCYLSKWQYRVDAADSREERFTGPLNNDVFGFHAHYRKERQC